MELANEKRSTEKHTMELITQCMHQLGIPAHLKGHLFLREAIMMAVADSESVKRITKIIYPRVARKCNSTGSKVERAIRNAVEVAWIRGDTDLQKKIFKCSREECDRPTNTAFIAPIAHYLRASMENKD